MDNSLDKMRTCKIITFTQDEQNFGIQTPCCIMHTRTGCIPHLTNETLKYLNPHLFQNIYQIPLPSIIDYQDILHATSGTAVECFSLPNNSLLYATVQDASCPPSSGYNNSKSVAMWVPAGKISVTSENYMKVIEALKPDLFQVLADSDIFQSESRKRVTKSVDRSLQYLEECLALHQQNESLKNSKLICMIEGGSILEERKRCVKLMLEKIEMFKDDIWGFTIDALPSDTLISTHTEMIIKAVVEALPKDKPVLVHGFGHPVALIDLIECGISMFDSTYVTRMSEKHQAFTYLIPQSGVSAGANTKNEGEKNSLEKECLHIETLSDQFSDVIDISDSCYAHSFGPLLESCTCYTCVHHTRAYLQHLTVVNEMLCPVLLMLHNLHHYLTFFCAIRTELETHNNLKMFKEKLLKLNNVKT